MTQKLLTKAAYFAILGLSRSKGKEVAVLSCFSPMLAVRTGRLTSNNKPEYKFLSSLKKYYSTQTGYDQDFRELGNPTVGVDPELYPVDFVAHYYDPSTGELMRSVPSQMALVLPCGQCLACRTAYAAQWADRILLEAQYHKDSYFLTLTYDDDHLPRRISKDGEEVFSLDHEDLQLFMKRLRRQQEYHHGNQIRFYAVGEYGSLRHRPHYHILVFGLVLDDLKEIGKNKLGRMLHDSPTIRELWSKGLTEVDRMTWEAAAYCARYTVKKLGKDETGFYESQNLCPEFSRMSLKPAIGAQYFDDNIERIYKSDQIVIPVSDGVRKVKPPSYYDQLFDEIYPSQMQEIKANRQELAREALKLRMDRYSGNYFELLAAEEAAFKAKTKSLRRSLE